MVMADVPYGVTGNKWDSVIDLPSMWDVLGKVCHDRTPIVLTASQPFTSTLIMSNPDKFKYTWTWDKVNRHSGFLNAKKQPIRVTEDVCVFYQKQPTYNPQMTEGVRYEAKSVGRKSDNYGKQSDTITRSNGLRYPKNLLSIKADERGSVGRIHPTQKPIELMRYFIRTYTDPGGVVLDFTMGSGTTGVACALENRKFIGIEIDSEIYQTAKQRIKAQYDQ